MKAIMKYAIYAVAGATFACAGWHVDMWQYWVAFMIFLGAMIAHDEAMVH